MFEQANLYTLLGLPRNATQEDIRHAYHEAARRLHPDVNTEAASTELFLRIQVAYETLSHAKKRAEYDATLPAEIKPTYPIDIDIILSRRSLPVLDEPQLFYALLEVAAPPSKRSNPNDSPRSPLNVCLILDRSTSMQGERMDMVKTGAIEMIRKFRPEDIISIVAFGDKAEVLHPASRVTDISQVSTCIRMLQPRGGTEILRGLEAGFNEIRRNLNRRYINHMILLTDGRTYGDEAACLRLAAQAAESGVSITGLGIGEEWNDHFMDSLATRTGANSVYIARPGDIKNYLQEKFNHLGQSFAERVTLDLKLGPEIELNYAFRLHPESTPLSGISPLLLGSIPRESSIGLLLEFIIRRVRDENQQIQVATGELSLDIPTQAKPITQIPIKVSLPVKKDYETDYPPQAIIQAMSRLTLYRMQERARQEVASGKVQEATRRLHRLATHLLAQGKKDLAQTVFQEAEHIQNTHLFSEDGEKQIKYGTRSLLLPSGNKGETL